MDPAPAPEAAGSALFVSKSVATRQVLPEGGPFTQTIQLKNTGSTAWNGCVLVRLKTFGASGKTTDALGSTVDSVAVPTTAAGATASIALSLTATKSNPKSGAAQSAPWELRSGNGTKIPIMVNPTTPAKGGAVWTTVTLNPKTGSNVPNLSHAGYTDPAVNLYVKISNGGQCTAFVYGRIVEKLGIYLEKVPGSAFGSNAAGQKWIDQLTGAGKPYILSAEPKANSIAVWTLNSSPLTAGHVAFVESVNAGNVGYNEANVDGWQSFASDNGPDSDTWGGGGYDGRVKVATTAAMATHLGTKYALKGYIVVA